MVRKAKFAKPMRSGQTKKRIRANHKIAAFRTKQTTKQTAPMSLHDAIDECNRRLKSHPKYDFGGVKVVR